MLPHCGLILFPSLLNNLSIFSFSSHLNYNKIKCLVKEKIYNKYLFKSFAHFSIRWSDLYICRGSLNILDISTLLLIYVVNICSSSVAFVFSLYVQSLGELEFLILMWSVYKSFPLWATIYIYLYFKNIHSEVINIFLVFSSKMLVILHLMFRLVTYLALIFMYGLRQDAISFFLPCR